MFLFECVCVDMNVCESTTLQLCVRECTSVCVSERKRERVFLKPRSGSRHAITKQSTCTIMEKEKKRGAILNVDPDVLSTQTSCIVCLRETERENKCVCVCMCECKHEGNNTPLQRVWVSVFERKERQRERVCVSICLCVRAC